MLVFSMLYDIVICKSSTCSIQVKLESLQASISSESNRSKKISKEGLNLFFFYMSDQKEKEIIESPSSESHKMTVRKKSRKTKEKEALKKKQEKEKGSDGIKGNEKSFQILQN